MIYRPVAEAAAGTVMASWVAFGSAIQLSQDVLGPDTAVGVGIVVNGALLLGALYLLFQAGGTFRGWLQAVNAALDMSAEIQALRVDMEAHRARVAEAEAETARLRARIIENERLLEELRSRNGHRSGGAS